MPEGVGYASSNVIAGTGLDLNYVQDRVYAFSGIIGATNTETDLLNFTTGNKVVDGQVYLALVSNSADDYIFNVYINNILAFGAVTKAGANYGMPRNVIIPIIVSPYTVVRVTAQNVSDSSSQNCCATINGKVL